MFSSIFSNWIPKKFMLLLSEVENNKITELTLDNELFETFGCYIRNEKVHDYLEHGLKKLKEALIKNTSVDTLYFHGYTIPREITHVIEALFENKHIKKIYFNCSVGYTYQSYFKLAEALKVNNNIEYLFIQFACISANNYMPKILAALHSNTGLKTLAINRPHILGGESRKAFAELPLHNSSLEKVEIYTLERLITKDDQPTKVLINPAILRKDTYFNKLPKDLIIHLDKFIEKNKINEFNIKT